MSHLPSSSRHHHPHPQIPVKRRPATSPHTMSLMQMQQQKHMKFSFTSSSPSPSPSPSASLTLHSSAHHHKNQKEKISKLPSLSSSSPLSPLSLSYSFPSAKKLKRNETENEKEKEKNKENLQPNSKDMMIITEESNGTHPEAISHMEGEEEETEEDDDDAEEEAEIPVEIDSDDEYNQQVAKSLKSSSSSFLTPFPLPLPGRLHPSRVILPTHLYPFPYQSTSSSSSPSQNIFTHLSALRRTSHPSFPKSESQSNKIKFHSSSHQLSHVIDTHHDILLNNTFDIPFLHQRSKINEILTIHNIIFLLTHSGVCSAYNRQFLSSPSSRLCYLNTQNDEVIRSLFHNKTNDHLITVSVYRSDSFSTLRCRSTPLSSIMSQKPHLSTSLFTSESLHWPGFVEFDDVNKKILTFSSTDKMYKIWEMNNYSLLYSLDDSDIEEIKIAPNILLCVYKRLASSSHIQIKIVNIHNGKEISKLLHFLHRNKKIDFIEQFHDKLLIKQSGEDLQIVDIHNSSNIHTISQSEFHTPSAFIFLYDAHMFLTFLNHHISVYNFEGKFQNHFEDNELYDAECQSNHISITPDQKYIIAYCREKDEKDNGSGNPSGNNNGKTGTINISHIQSGKLMGKIIRDKSGETLKGISLPKWASVDSGVDHPSSWERRKVMERKSGGKLYLNKMILKDREISEDDKEKEKRRQNHIVTGTPSSSSMSMEIDNENDENVPPPDPNVLPSSPSPSPSPPSPSPHNDKYSTPTRPNNKRIFSRCPTSSSSSSSSPSALTKSHKSSSTSTSSSLSSRSSSHSGVLSLDSSVQDDFSFFESVDPFEDVDENYRRRLTSLDKKESLKDITAVYYNYETNEIYTGNKHGVLHVWK